MFTAGGRAQMIAWRITKEAINCGGNNGPVRNVSNNSANVQYEHLKTFSLVHKRRNRKSNLDPETRIMSVSAFSLQEIVECESHLCIVACGCSDGFLRVYLFDEKKPSFLLVFQSDFHDHCLLRVGHVILGPANHRSAYIYSSATDGKLILWDVGRIVSVLGKATREKIDVEDVIEIELEESGVEFVSLSLSLTLHQSGINAVALRKLSESEILLATAGDDNCLSVTKLKKKENGNFEMVWILKELNAHATEITGVKFFSDNSVVTASIDQRVTLWHINEDLQKIEFRASRFVNVADISDLELLSRNSEDLFIVSGQGLQTFTVTSSS